MSCIDAKYLVGILAYALLEFILGRRAKLNPSRSGSVVEIITMVAYGVFVVGCVLWDLFKLGRANGRFQ